MGTSLAAAVSAALPGVRADLEDLVRIESVWADPDRHDAVRRSAEAVAALLTDAGFYPDDRLRTDSGLLPGVHAIGSGPVVHRLWGKPAIAVIGIDAPAAGGASNTLVPSARAKISMRIAPGSDAAASLDALVTHLQAHVPWGAEIHIERGELGSAYAIDARGPAYDAARSAFREAWDGTEPVDIGVGGSIPFIAEFAKIFPDAAIVVTGVEDPDTRAHGINEGLHLAEFARVCLAEALLLSNLADTTDTARGQR